ncbi:hypothetical protein [Nonomuraea sediminis]|uniref:hypothetical protein n=1 Tax=Nonomuraea sediminis TaxID=2835864 RepID=UPI001BDD293A|nr:hypothetical protein [Nonomuraea sediminis]
MRFRKLETGDIDAMAVVAQSLDNQWVPPDLLHEMIDKRLEFSDVRERLRAAVRGEYIRSLINSTQVVINRSFFYNNPVLFEDFLPGATNRAGFIELLDQGAIVQMLLAERTPVEPPAFLVDQHAPHYTFMQQGWDAWEATAEEAEVHSLRLSWNDDGLNGDLIRQRLAAEFTRKAQTLVNLYGPTLAGDLGVDIDTAHAIKRRLADVAARCVQLSVEDKVATRETMYKEFLTADRSEPILGRFDRSRPFTAYVKQLIDLTHSANMAVALETLALTPADALHRATLQEWRSVGRGPQEVSAEQIGELLRGLAFEVVSEDLYLDTFAKLSLRDVVDVRASRQWADYVRLMKGMLEDPLGRFADPRRGAPAVIAAYVDLLAETTRIAAGRERPDKPLPMARSFALVASVDVAGALLEFTTGPHGVHVVVAGAVASTAASEVANVTVRVGLRALERRRRVARFGKALDTRTQILTGRTGDRAARFWQDLVAQFEAHMSEETMAEVRRRQKTDATVEGGDEAVDY